MPLIVFQVFEEGGSYRAAIKIRPVIKASSEAKDEVVKRNQMSPSKVALSPNSNPPPPPPPPEHPPPPPPITQVMKVDNKSDYATCQQQSTTDGAMQPTNERVW